MEDDFLLLLFPRVPDIINNCNEGSLSLSLSPSLLSAAEA
jgi:hypothetical protein